jgi:hypothetical protein
MQCPKCRIESPPSTDRCDCGYSFENQNQLRDSADSKKCQFCAEFIKIDASKCRFCGERLGDARRPTAGIAVATIFGLVGLIWSGYELMSATITDPAGLRATLFRSFPGYQTTAFMGTSLGLVGNSVLLVGAFMSFFYHPHGRTVVRVASWAMIAVILLLTLVTINLVVSSSTWESLGGSTRDGFLGGLVGGALGGALQWGLILFLFRTRVSRNQIQSKAQSA